MVVVVALLLAVPVSADANQEASSRSLFYISWSANLYKESSTQFDICFDVIAKDVMVKLGVSEVKVQRSLSGSVWTTIDTLTPSDYPEFMGYNTDMHMDYILYTARTGYYYRAYITYYAENSDGNVGIMYEYTDVVKLP
jgi:hypothetical protein